MQKYKGILTDTIILCSTTARELSALRIILQESREKSIKSLNASAGKLYRINMSVGIVSCVIMNSYDLKGDIDKAEKGDMIKYGLPDWTVHY